MKLKTEEGLVYGGVPRADLLPPEIRVARRDKTIIRMLIVGLVVVAAVVVGGVGFATVRSLASEIQLVDERARSEKLLAAQLEFADAKAVANRVDESITARQLTTVSEIAWKAYLDEISATLPEGISLTSLEVTTVSTTDEPTGAPVEETPLQGDSVATITIEAQSLTVPDVEAWLDDLADITGFAGIAPPATVEGSPETGYKVGLELLVSEKAYLLRFQDKEEGEG